MAREIWIEQGHFDKRLAGMTVTWNCTYFYEYPLDELLILYKIVTGQKTKLTNAQRPSPKIAHAFVCVRAPASISGRAGAMLLLAGVSVFRAHYIVYTGRPHLRRKNSQIIRECISKCTKGPRHCTPATRTYMICVKLTKIRHVRIRFVQVNLRCKMLRKHLFALHASIHALSIDMCVG